MNPAVEARKLLERLEISDISSLPEEAARRLGVEIVEGTADTVDAMIVHVLSQRPVIAVNKNRPLHRRRFSLAHELGHLVLKHESSVSFLSKPLSGTLSISVRHDAHLEREANAFAAELLMPKVMLAREAHKFTLKELSRRYVVSVQAMRIRLKELGLVCKDMPSLL